MRHRLTIPRQILLNALPALLDGHVAWGLAAKATLAETEEFLLARLESGSAPAAEWGIDTDGKLPFLLRAGEAWRNGKAWQDWLAQVGIDQARPLGIAAVTAEGGATGWIRTDGSRPWQALAEIRLPGAGMVHTGITGEAPPQNSQGDDKAAEGSVAGRYSRLAGALSPAVLSRLQDLSYAVIGVSRMGSHVAHGLCRLGCRYIILVDPDTVESHNADVGLFHPHHDEGRHKSAVVARDLRRLAAPGGRVDEYTQTLQSPLPLSAVREADVIISCVDDDGARVVAALLAASHLRIHLDLGAGVQAADGNCRIAGADIRLVVPEDRPRCLFCFGGLAQPGDLRRLAGFDNSPPPTWDTLRAGSLGSVDEIAVGLGRRLIERLVAGDISRSTWLRYEDAPLPTLRETTPRQPWNCPVCGPAWGIGDAIFTKMDLRLRHLARVIPEAAGKAGA